MWLEEATSDILFGDKQKHPPHPTAPFLLVNRLAQAVCMPSLQLPTVRVPVARPGAAAYYQPPTAAQAAEAALWGELPSVPGLLPQGSAAAAADVDAFLRGMHGPQQGMPPNFAEFESIYSGAAGPSSAPFGQPQTMQPLPPRQQQQQQRPALGPLTPLLQTFFDSGRAQAPFRPMPLPAPAVEALSMRDKCRIRDRSTILARQLFTDLGGHFADEQVSSLLASLNIDVRQLPATAADTPEAWDRIYQAAAPRQAGGAAWHPRSVSSDHAAAAAMMAAGGGQAQQWAADFAEQQRRQQQQQRQGPAVEWAEEFTDLQAPGGAWASEFSGGLGAVEGQLKVEGRVAEDGDALAQTRRLADTLAADSNPKFQNSKFLKFLSKMSRGELVLEENKVWGLACGWVGEGTRVVLHCCPLCRHWASVPPHLQLRHLTVMCAHLRACIRVAPGARGSSRSRTLGRGVQRGAGVGAINVG